MSEELQKSAANLLDAARAAGQDAVSFINTQAPDVARQLISYHLLSSIIWTIFNILFASGLLFVWLKLFKWAKKEDKLDEFEFGCPSMFMIIAFLISFFAGFFYFINIIQCIYAPKAVLFNMIFRPHG